MDPAPSSLHHGRRDTPVAEPEVGYLDVEKFMLALFAAPLAAST